MRKFANNAICSMVISAFFISSVKDSRFFVLASSESNEQNVLNNAINMQSYPVSNAISIQNGEITLSPDSKNPKNKKKNNTNSIDSSSINR